MGKIKKFDIKKLGSSELAAIALAEKELKKFVPAMADKEIKDSVLYFAESVWRDRGSVIDMFLLDSVDHEIHRRTGKKTMRQIKNEQEGF